MIIFAQLDASLIHFPLPKSFHIAILRIGAKMTYESLL
jgi:hypothetical protein